MSSIDERIVEMRFNNKQFEDGVQTSVKSLDKLKEGLKLEQSAQSLMNLERVGRGFSLDGIAAGVDHISNKFNALGAIGFTVLQGLTNSAMGLARKMAGFVFDPLVAGGKRRAINIEQAKFQFEGLGMDVEATMANALEAVQGTAYGLDEAAKVASMFGASGMRAGEKMTSSLRAIAGVAAMSSSSYEDIGNIFTAVAGQGRLMGNQLLQLSGRGINAAATLGKHFGYTEEAVREMVTKGQISFEMFSEAMDSAFGEHAKSANKTFTGSLSNVRAALARIGAAVWTPALENLRDIFNALIPVIDSVKKGLDPLIGSLSKVMKAISSGIIAKLGALDLTGVGALVPIFNGLKNVFQGLKGIMKPIKEAFKEVFPPITGKRLLELAESFRMLTKNFKIGYEDAKKLKAVFKGLFSVASAAIHVVKSVAKIFGALVSAILPAGGGLLSIISSLGEFLTKVSESIKASTLFSDALRILKDVLKPLPDDFNIFQKIGAVLMKVAPGFWEFASSVGAVFEKVGKKIREFFKLITFEQSLSAINTGFFGALVLALKNLLDIFSGFAISGGGALSGISGLLDGVKGSLEAYQTQLKAGTLLKIAAAIGILAAALVVLSVIDPKKLASALGAITVLFIELFATMAIFQKFTAGMGVKQMVTTTSMLIALSAGILLLSVAMLILSRLDGAGIAKGLVAIGFLLAGLFLFMKATDMYSMTLKSAAGIFILATGIALLATSVWLLGSMDVGTLLKGLGAIGALLLGLGIFANAMAGTERNIITTAFALAILAGALLLMSVSILILGNMAPEKLGKGLLALAIALTIMGVAMKFMKGSAAGAAALLLMAAAIAVLTPSLVILGNMKTKKIVKALLALAGVFAVLGLAAVVLGPLTPVIFSLAGAVALLGLAVLAIGVGLTMFAGGLAALAVSGLAGGAALVAVISGLAGMIPYVLGKVGEGILELAKIIGEGAPILVDAVMNIIRTFLDAVLNEIPSITMKGIDMVLALIAGIISKLPEIIQAGFDLIIAFLNGLADALRSNDDIVIDAVENLVGAIVEAAKNAFTSYFTSFKNIGKNLIDGLLSGMRGSSGDVEKEAAKVGGRALVGISKKLGVESPSKEFFKVGQYLDQGLANGMDSLTGKVTTSAKNVGASAISALSGSIGNISDLVSGDMNLNPTIRPVLDMGGVNGSMADIFGKDFGINVSGVKAKTASINTVGMSRKATDEAPIARGSNQQITINVTGNHIASDYDVNRIANNLSSQLAREQRRSR